MIIHLLPSLAQAASLAVGIGLLPVLVLIAIVAGVIILRLRAGPKPFARLRRRHIITRIICGSAGAGILIALCIGTWRQLEGAPLTAAQPAGKVLHLPALPSPLEANRQAAPRDANFRLLLQLLLVDPAAGRPEILDAAEFDVQPSDYQGGRKLRAAFEVDDAQVRVDIRVFEADISERGGKLFLHARGPINVDETHRYGGRSRSMFGSLAEDRVISEPGSSDSLPNTNPLSLLPPASPSSRRKLLLLLTTPVAANDPLREVPLAEAAKALAGRVSECLTDRAVESRAYSPEGRFGVREGRPGGVLALGGFVGPAGLLLAVAAGLLAQLFLRRPLALAALLAVMVLYVAAWDRVALARQVTVARDSQSAVAARVSACAAAGDTFFYRDTARRSLEALAADPATPEALATAAGRTAYLLDHTRWRAR